MGGKNPFDHGGKRPGKNKPRHRVPPRAGMMLSAGGSGLEVMSHNKSTEDYRQRMPMSEDLPREEVIKPKPIRKAIPPDARLKKEDNRPLANRRAAMLTATAQGFEIMDNNLSKDNYTKRVRDAQELPAAEKAEVISKSKLTGSNYIKSYRNQQALDKAAAEKKAKDQAKIDKIYDKRRGDIKKFFDEKQETERTQALTFSARARQLQTEIALLRRNLGMDAETDRRIHGAIQQLMNELGRIPSVYW